MHLHPTQLHTTRAHSVRLPRQLSDYLQAQAHANHRTVSGEILHRLELSRLTDQQTTKQPANKENP